MQLVYLVTNCRAIIYFYEISGAREDLTGFDFVYPYR